MTSRKNYYRVLHVQRDAPVEVIRSSYRTMMQKLRMHPDLGGDHEGAALINEAYAVLSDLDARADYDARMAVECEPASPADDRTGAAEGAVVEDVPVEPHADATDDRCLFCSARCRSIQYREPDDVCGNCDAPLYPAEQRRFEVDSKRAIERIPTQTSAAYSVKSNRALQHQGLVQDISLNGLQLSTVAELQRDQLVLIRTDVLDAVARVINSRKLTSASTVSWRVGMVFLTMKLHRSRGSFVSVDV